MESHAAIAFLLSLTDIIWPVNNWIRRYIVTFECLNMSKRVILTLVNQKAINKYVKGLLESKQNRLKILNTVKIRFITLNNKSSHTKSKDSFKNCQCYANSIRFLFYVITNASETFLTQISCKL